MESQKSTASGAIARGQFLHVEKYAVKAPRGKAGGNDITKVANEAERVPGFCPHVESPRQPVRLAGVSMHEAAGFSRSWAEAKFTPYSTKAGEPKKRRYRVDEPSALVGVISVPPEMPIWRWFAFRRKTLVWLSQKYGDRLKSVVEHTDEPQRHLHYWVVPRPGEEFSAVHPGVLALRRLAPGAKRAVRDLAYKIAMSELQDEFHIAVGGQFGLERKTVGGERWSRGDVLAHRFAKAREEDAFARGLASAAAELDAMKRQLALQQALIASLNVVPAPVQVPQSVPVTTRVSDAGSARPPSAPAKEPAVRAEAEPCGTVPHPIASRPSRTGPRP